jgi:hypothetical protein
MKGGSRIAGALFVLAAAVALVGCAVVDQYSGRAVAYNVEAENAQEQALLLNIVRAYLRRPMQFTTVSSITGTATASGTVGYSRPANVPFRPVTDGTSIAQFPALPTYTVAGSVSGGPTFQIPVLDTQEFYQGLLKPVPTQLWDLYIQNSYPADLLFNLFIGKIVIRKLDKCAYARGDGNDQDQKACSGRPDDASVCNDWNHETNCELVLPNYVGDDVNIDLFQIFSDYLLAVGLTTGPEKKPNQVLNPAVNVNLNVVRGSSNLLGGASTPGDSSSGADVAVKYSLCFAPRSAEDSYCVLSDSLCGAKETNRSAIKNKMTKSAPLSYSRPESHRTCDIRIIDAGAGTLKRKGLRFTLTGSMALLGQQQFQALQNARNGANLSFQEILSRRGAAESSTQSPGISGAILSGEVISAMWCALDRSIAKKSKIQNEENEAPSAKYLSQPWCRSDGIKSTTESKIDSEYTVCATPISDSDPLRDLKKMRCDLLAFETSPVVIELYSRSVEGIIYYLGEIARRANDPDFEADRRDIYFTTVPHYADYPEKKCVNPDPKDIQSGSLNKLCHPIFVLDKVPVAQPGAFLSTYYDGVIYSVPKDLYSAAVLDIVKQALALSSSAKSLPQSNVISVVAGGQ